jgi:hypothetical protein
MIQSTVTTEPTQTPPMQWDIAQLVIYPKCGRVILTNGKHDPERGTFEGQVVLQGSTAEYPVGTFSRDWTQEFYQRLPENQTVKLQNV